MILYYTSVNDSGRSRLHYTMRFDTNRAPVRGVNPAPIIGPVHAPGEAWSEARFRALRENRQAGYGYIDPWVSRMLDGIDPKHSQEAYVIRS